MTSERHNTTTIRKRIEVTSYIDTVYLYDMDLQKVREYL